ncbi:hypothetical protein [Frankia sp. AvcI1]|uniref:hypothetical protein n=1 Tax=Frankia sp. AvcI1 TaxID=573496 RepID=UPI002117B3B2|nr:hypothetical protein [Frankia sp. AvcI1]
MPVTPPTPPRRTAPAGKTSPPAKPAAAAPPPLAVEVARLADAVEFASDPGRILRETAARVDDLAGKVRAVRAGQLRARREAITATADTARETRRAALRARRAELLARPLPPLAKTTAAAKGKAATAVRTSTVPPVPARKTLPRRSGR